MANKGWRDTELLVAMNLYCRLPFGCFHSRHPKVIEFANLLGRTSGALAMKLCNLASLDSTHQARGVKGLGNASRMDREIWRQFEENWTSMVQASEEAVQSLAAGLSVEGDFCFEINTDYTGYDVLAEIKRRQGQQFFRESVLASYEDRCCITGNPLPELLIASHILPWAVSQKDRLNPRNGLCLARTQDAAFDAGLITLDEEFRVLLSPRLQEVCSEETLNDNFKKYEGRQINLPTRFRPDKQFIAYHRRIHSAA